MQAKSSGVDLDMLRQMSSVGYKSLHGEAAADLYKISFYMRNIDKELLTYNLEKYTGRTETQQRIKDEFLHKINTFSLDDDYLLRIGAKDVFEQRMEKIQAGQGQLDWTMESIFRPDHFGGALTPAQCVDKMIEVMHEYDVQTANPKSQDTKNYLGDNDLLDALFASM